MFAICENGGMANEYVHEGRWHKRSDALRIIRELQDEESIYLDEDEEPTKFDVVRVLDDGSITTEC